MDNLPRLQQERPLRFRMGDVIGSIIIGEAVAWLLFIMVRVNAKELPIPAGLVETLNSLATGIALAVALPLLSVVGLAFAFAIGKRLRVIYQAAKFALVGAFNTFVDLGVLNALILATDVTSGTLFVAFKGASFLVAVVNSYAWNKYWTFERTGHEVGKEFVQFFTVSVVGFFVNIGTATVVVNVVGPQGGAAPEVWANVGALAATAASLVWNFIGYKFWVFKK